jgi:hypothetical protein
MKTILLQVDDDKLELFLTILNNLKDGLIENLKISEEPIVDTVSDDEQEFYEKLIKNMSEDDRIISSKETVCI